MNTQRENHGDKSVPQRDPKESGDKLDPTANTEFKQDKHSGSQTIQESPETDPNENPEKAPFKRSNA